MLVERLNPLLTDLGTARHGSAIPESPDLFALALSFGEASSGAIHQGRGPFVAIDGDVYNSGSEAEEAGP
jgi:hypothetical protein